MNVTMTANEGGECNRNHGYPGKYIHKVAEIVHNIDSSAEDVTVVKVFHLLHADPTETADLLTNIISG